MVKAQPNRRHSEGPIARSIEEETAKLPSDAFLWAAGAAVGTSLALRLMGRSQTSTFVGQWVAPILICGLYNKMVKTHGHDAADQSDSGYTMQRRKVGSNSTS